MDASLDWWVAVVAVLAVVGLLAVVPGAWASAPAFTQLSGSPFSTGAGTFPVSVAFSRGGLLATANSFNFDKSSPGTVSVFSAGANGTLTQVNGSPLATGARATVGVAFSPTGGLLAAINGLGPLLDAPQSVSVFSVGQVGRCLQ